MVGIDIKSCNGEIGRTRQHFQRSLILVYDEYFIMREPAELSPQDSGRSFGNLIEGSLYLVFRLRRCRGMVQGSIVQYDPDATFSRQLEEYFNNIGLIQVI